MFTDDDQGAPRGRRPGRLEPALRRQAEGARLVPGGLTTRNLMKAMGPDRTSGIGLEWDGCGGTAGRTGGRPERGSSRWKSPDRAC